MKPTGALPMISFFLLFGLAGLARADVGAPKEPTARQAARLRARVATALNERGLHVAHQRGGLFTPDDIVFSVRNRGLEGPRPGRKTGTSHLEFFAKLAEGERELHTHTGAIPLRHYVTPAIALPGTITVRTGTPRGETPGVEALDHTITVRGITTEAKPAYIELR